MDEFKIDDLHVYLRISDRAFQVVRRVASDVHRNIKYWGNKYNKFSFNQTGKKSKRLQVIGVNDNSTIDPWATTDTYLCSLRCL